MPDAPVLSPAAAAKKVKLDDSRLRRALHGPARAPERARRAGRAPPRHGGHEDARRWSPAAAPSRGARRAPAARAPARTARRSGPAAARCSDRSRAPTPSRSTARSSAPRCAARSRCTPSAARSRSSTRRRSRRRRRARRSICSTTGTSRARRSWCSAPRSPRPRCRFRNLAASPCSTPESVGVTDLLGAASLLVSEPALAGAHARARQRRRPRRAGARTGRGGEGLMEHTQVIIRPVVSEKSYVLSAANRYTFRVHPDAHKTQIRQAVEALFDVHVVEVRTMSVKSKPKRRGITRGRTRAWKKAIVQVRAGREHPDLPGPGGPRLGASAMPIRKPKPTSPGQALRLLPGLRRDHQVQSPRRRSSKGSRRAAGATPTGARPRATAAAAPSAPTGGSTSSGARTASPRRSPRSSTTPTAPPTSRCCTTSTARSATSSRPSA